MNDEKNNEAKILTINGEDVTPEMEKERKEQLSKAKAELAALLEKGEIDGVEYNRRVVELEVPAKIQTEHRVPKKKKIRLLAIMFLIIALAAIPAAIYINWRFYFQNTLTTVGVPNYSGMLKSSLKNAPIQINLDGNYSESGEYKGRPIQITYKAYYDITGIVTSVRDYWSFGAYDTLAPRDLCMIWGDLAERYPSADMRFYHGERFCSFEVPAQYINQSRTGALGSTHYGSSLVSNNHLIPSTAEVRNTILRFSVGDTARIVGYLVRVDYDDISLDSSMTRDDVIYDHTSTTCEIIYVTNAEKLN